MPTQPAIGFHLSTSRCFLPNHSPYPFGLWLHLLILETCVSLPSSSASALSDEAYSFEAYVQHCARPLHFHHPDVSGGPP